VHFETESILVDATWATGHIDVARIVDDSDGVGSVKGNYFGWVRVFLNILV
jgi:hypothetical protein